VGVLQVAGLGRPGALAGRGQLLVAGPHLAEQLGLGLQGLHGVLERGLVGHLQVGGSVPGLGRGDAVAEKDQQGLRLGVGQLDHHGYQLLKG
jgi:hypothetical protein